jgi:ABC-2 type transport system permease protein
VASGVTPMVSWLVLPVILGGLVLVTAGMAMLLSALFVWFRDVQPIWEVLLQVIFYASPVIISIQTVKEKLGTTALHLYMLNPLAVIFQQFRHSMVTHATPSAGQALGSWTALLEPMAIVLAIFAVGFAVFDRSAARIAENL